MAVYRKAPTCPECGETIKGKHYEPQTFFCGDTFRGWDWDNHVCRLGTKYFIERTDTIQWWIKGGWTNDPMAAMMWSTKKEAENYLLESIEIPPRIPCYITEHEFVRVKPAREPNLKDALTGFRKKR